MNITWIGSPNYTAGRGGNKINGVIIHWMAGNLASTDSVFQNRTRNTSAHYGVEGDVVHQYVKEDDTAYQAGNWTVNQQTIGIEHSAQPGRDAVDATYENSAQIIAAAAKKYGFSVVGATARPHNMIVATTCPGTVDVTRLINRANAIIGGGTSGAPVTPAPTPIPVPAVSTGTATVTVDSVRVRVAPNTSADLGGSKNLTRGQTFDYVGAVQGQSVNGVSTWLKSTKGNYVWAGGTNYPTTPPVTVSTGGTAQAIRQVNVRVAPDTSAALGGSKTLAAGQTFGYSAKVHGQYVNQNGVGTDIWYHSNVGNYVWSGNCKDI